MTNLRYSPMQGKRPTRADLARFAKLEHVGVDDVLPSSTSSNVPLKLLIVGINPGIWTAAVNAPFAHPGNRFWPSLHQAGITNYLVDATRGLSNEDEAHLIEQGIGTTNLVDRATSRADQLFHEELRAGARRLVTKVRNIEPKAVAIAGITAFRIAFSLPKASLGLQHTESIADWPAEIPLWVVPQPSGLNAHETVASLAQKWRVVIEIL